MEVAVVGAVVGALVNNIVAKLSAVIDKRSSELSDLAGDITYLKTELLLIASKIDAQHKEQPTSELQQISMAAMRDLAFDIEDCLDQFLPCAACEGGAVSLVDLVDFALQVRSLKKRLEEAHKQLDGANARQKAPDAAGKSVRGRAQAEPTSKASDQVGIEKPKQEILGLLDSEKLMVISIVGFGGSGKTELAWAVFDCPEVKKNFGLRAWHLASKHKDGDELLVAIVKHLHPQETLSADQILSQAPMLHSSIRARLQNTRCLIVIDDIEMHQWGKIKEFFAELRIIRILLTTTVQTVANGCTEDSGYIYNMKTLSAEDSKNLLKKRVGKLNRTSPDLADGSAAIVHKCHGHPLALISVANYLQQQNQITGRVCQDTSRRLCKLMDKNKNSNFTKLVQVLVDNYSNLPSDLKTCLLYTSLFPNDRPVSRKTLTSRWLAEGYIGDQEAADEKFKELMDRNIIRPMDASTSGEAKTCKPHGIMHQFMLHKSISSNFITPSVENRGNFRHIIVENHATRRSSNMDHVNSRVARRPNRLKKLLCSCFIPSTSAGYDEELRPRSLTVFGSAEQAVYSDLITCKLLRVLDLKECNNLEDEHIKNIYKLLHLKYLTLGSSVSELSGAMINLHCLETLDLRKTNIDTLPVEVISLPHLAHLFGKIRLKRAGGQQNRRNSKLQTVAGVVVDGDSGFPELMEHMGKLTKVKIWCEISSTEDRNYALLSDAIHKFAEDGTDTSEGARSLSLHLNDCSKDLLRQRQDTNATSRQPSRVLYLSSLKLQGSLSQFCEFAKSLSGLEELCLTNTNLQGADLIAGLRELRYLVYLKLVEDHLADLEINPGDVFPSLQRLCLVVQQPGFPRIARGALQNLVSLQLLCKDLVGLCDDIKLEHFEYLREVALDSMVNQETTIELWEIEAKKHPKRPKVLLLKRVEPADSRCAVKYIAIDHGSSDPLVQGTP